MQAAASGPRPAMVGKPSPFLCVFLVWPNTLNVISGFCVTVGGGLFVWFCREGACFPRGERISCGLLLEGSMVSDGSPLHRFQGIVETGSEATAAPSPSEKRAGRALPSLKRLPLQPSTSEPESTPG